MLTLVRSPVPGLLAEADSLPPEVQGLRQRIGRQPHAWYWIVPTARRRRDLLRRGPEQGENGGACLPRLHTFDSFVAEALSHSLDQRVTISEAERLLRLARAWHDVTGRGARTGLVRQLDRFLQAWQAGDTQAIPDDLFERVVHRYAHDLARDRRLDRRSALGLLAREAAAPASGPRRLLLARLDGILFDGFHQLTPAEVEAVAALAGATTVVAWLVGMPGQQSWQTLASLTAVLQGRQKACRVVDHVPPARRPLQALGRSLFPLRAATPAQAPGQAVLPVHHLEAANPAAEVEAVARHIKEEYLARASEGQPARLHEVAVVIPSPAYEPLLREVFTRLGLPYHLGDRGLPVAASRPARVLRAALRLVRGQWRHDLLLDFLNQPLVRRRLRRAHRLHELVAQRPRLGRRFDGPGWVALWREQLRRLRLRIGQWERREVQAPEWGAHDLPSYITRKTELADDLEELVASIETVLQPVSALEALAGGPPSSAPARRLATTVTALLRTLHVTDWLTPSAAHAAVPWEEYERDQRAYQELLGCLDVLAALPPSRLPVSPQGRPDLLAALLIALEGTHSTTAGDDDAGVQVLAPEEVPGLHFREVFALGLLDGQVPALPPEDETLPAAVEETEVAPSEAVASYLFSQLFEAAHTRLVLSHPSLHDGEEALPSRYLKAVTALGKPARLPEPRTVLCPREAARWLGRLARPVPHDAPLPLPDGPADAFVQRTLGALDAWRARRRAPVRLDSPALLARLFPATRAFSPSELETYAACPFRYLGGHLLRLEEREQDQTRTHYGSFVHRVLQLYYVECRRQASLPDDLPLPATSAAERARFLELFRREYEQLGDETLPEDLVEIFRCSAGVLDLYLDALRWLEGEPENYGNLLTELALSDVLLGTDAQGREVRLTGTIDRVDVCRAQMDRAIILDYKTGSIVEESTWRTRAEDGRMLQLPLYAAALERARPGLSVVGGAYVYLNDRKRSTERSPRHAIHAAGALLSEGKPGKVPFDQEAARQKAIELVEEIRAGHFPLTAYPAEECTGYCPLRHACRQPGGYQVSAFT